MSLFKKKGKIKKVLEMINMQINEGMEKWMWPSFILPSIHVLLIFGSFFFWLFHFPC